CSKWIASIRPPKSKRMGNAHATRALHRCGACNRAPPPAATIGRESKGLLNVDPKNRQPAVTPVSQKDRVNAPSAENFRCIDETVSPRIGFAGLEKCGSRMPVRIFI